MLGTLLVFSLSISAKGVTPFEGCVEKGTEPDVQLPRSPEQLIRAVEWAYDHRSVAGYRDLLTADFQMVCAGTTTGSLRTREDEVQSFARLVDLYRMPAVRELALDFEPNLMVSRDPRPAFAESQYHAVVRTGFTLQFAEGSDPVRTVTGQLQFFVVRGDHPDLEDAAGRKLAPDPRVWYIQRSEDVTTSGDGWCGIPGTN
jgi:hypothetical protein